MHGKQMTPLLSRVGLSLGYGRDLNKHDPQFTVPQNWLKNELRSGYVLPIFHLVSLGIAACAGINSIWSLCGFHQRFINLVRQLKDWVSLVISDIDIVFNFYLEDFLRNSLIVFLNLFLQGVYLRFKFMKLFYLYKDIIAKNFITFIKQLSNGLHSVSLYLKMISGNLLSLPLLLGLKHGLQ